MEFLIIIATIVICAKFWRMGGDGQSLWRNPGVPAVIALAKFGLLCFAGWSWWNLLALAYIPALWGMIQAFSYGVSSPIHKFWELVFGQGASGNYAPVEITSRCTCGFFWSLPAAIFAYITGGWIIFGIYVLFLTILNGLIWAMLPNVEHNERAVGSCVSTSIFV